MIILPNMELFTFRLNDIRYATNSLNIALGLLFVNKVGRSLISKLLLLLLDQSRFISIVLR